MSTAEASIPVTVPLSMIRPGDNPRRYFDRAKHEELVNSLRLRGMIQPMLLRPTGDTDGTCLIVVGERRYRAALEAFGLEGEVPVVIREMTDQEALEAAIDENDIRDDASETEQADAAVRVLAACQNDRAEAARRLGWSPSKLDRRMALASLSDAVKLAIDERRIKIGHGELLAVVPADKQDKALNTILTAGLDVAKTRELLMRVTQSLAAAIFDKAECTTCPFNAASQRALFETHVDDGHCTNPGCFQLKTDAADKIRVAEEERAAEAAKAAGVPAAADAVPSGSTKTPAPNQATSAKPTAGAAAGKSTVTAASIAARVADVREAAWRTALARSLAANAAHGQTVILVAAMSGTLSQIKDKTLTARAGALVGVDFPSLDYKAKIEAIRALQSPQARNALAAIAAAYAMDVGTFGHVADLARAFEVDLRHSWQVDRSFLDRRTKDELKFIAQECGLVAHMGAKPFAKLLASPTRSAILDGMLNATGFTWAGRLPSSMTLDGKFAAPPAEAPPSAEQTPPAIAEKD